MKIVRPHTVDRESFHYGILLATEIASQYDKYSTHPSLVSECILGKLNLLKRKPKKNKAAQEMDKIISAIEKRVCSIECMTKFIYAMSKYQKPKKK